MLWPRPRVGDYAPQTWLRQVVYFLCIHYSRRMEETQRNEVGVSPAYDGRRAWWPHGLHAPVARACVPRPRSGGHGRRAADWLAASCPAWAERVQLGLQQAPLPARRARWLVRLLPPPHRPARAATREVQVKNRRAAGSGPSV